MFVYLSSFIAMQQSKEVIEDLLANDPEKAMEVLYSDYYEQMCNVVYRVLYDSTASEDIVQEVFMEIWRKRGDISFNTSIYGYLKRSCINRSLNYLRKNKINFEEDSVLEFTVNEDHTHNKVEAQDLEKIIQRSIASLPARCKQVFVLSRYENMTYKEISAELGISIKTVENQIAKALKVLKLNVLPYMKNSG